MDRNLINHIIGIVAVILVLGAGYLIKTKFMGEDKHIQLCQQEYQDFYYEILAEKNKDESLCDKITIGDKEYCKAIVNKNIKHCEMLTRETKQDCEKEIQKDPSACEQDDYYCLAEYTGNPSLCSGLKEDLREECIARAKLDADYFMRNKKKLCKEMMKEKERNGRTINI